MRLPELVRPIQDEADGRRAAQFKWYVLAAAGTGALMGTALAVLKFEPPDWTWSLWGWLLIFLGVASGLVFLLLAPRLSRTGQPVVRHSVRVALGAAILVVIGAAALLAGSP